MSDDANVLHFPSGTTREKAPRERPGKPIGYVEFAVASNFSFLRGASHPEQLMLQADHLGLAGLGLCDRNSVAGVVRAHLIRREQELSPRYHPGARLVFADDMPDILAYPRDRAAWGRLCRLLTRGNLRAEKGECILYLKDLLDHIEGLELVVMPDCTRDAPAKVLHRSRVSFADWQPPASLEHDRRVECETGSPLSRGRAGIPLPLIPAKAGIQSTPLADKRHLLPILREAAPGRVRLAAAMLYRGNDRSRLAARAQLAREAGIPLIAVNDVLYHHFDRRPLQDVLTCIRRHLLIDKAGRELAVNAERYLKPAAEMARLFCDAPQAVEETLRLSDALSFSLDELRYEYPDESIAGFATPQQALEHLVREGARQRYPGGMTAEVEKTLAIEFALIAERHYVPYFLTVYDIVRFARQNGILCQGRGSAANSTVCYCLGITSIDPVKEELLFERFISTERHEPPDIDVDFEHERREEVIQYVYDKYGRERTGIAATVISYRGRSAIREVGKAFGLSEDMIGALASSIWGGGGGNVRTDALRRAGLDPASPAVGKIVALVDEIQGFPRHLSQHVGGFVITRSRLDEVVPIMNGAMDKRTHVEWDKDDLDALGILKVDVLGLGMLTCIRKAFELVERHYELSCRLPALPTDDERGAFTLAAVPAEDPAVYRMLCRADSIGVFQVESRAQMSMLPRLRPREFYDLVIEVAIVRPGPIQGDMVHPYLRRREKLRQTGEEPDYPSPSPQHCDKDELKQVLRKTLGVPLFQEQAMKIAIVAGGFTPGEADKLRRAMATFKRTGTIGTFRHKMVEGMVAKGYARDFAERCFSQIEGFGEYGFPESHAASFALLVYASAWLKCRYPDVFAAALLNSQPMGFYASAQIVRDLREHGVEVRPVDVNFSHYDATLEPGSCAAERLHSMHRDMADDIRATHAMRLGLREVKGLSENDAKLIVAMRRLQGSTASAAAFPPPRASRMFPTCATIEWSTSETSDVDWGRDREGGRKPQPTEVTSTPFPTPPPQGGREQVVPIGEVVPYRSVRDLWLRTGLAPRVLERLADADAFGSLGLTRRQALWAVKALGRAGDQDDLPLLLSSSLWGGSTREAGEKARHTSAFPPPLWGRDREGGGRPGPTESTNTPLLTPPPRASRMFPTCATIEWPTSETSDVGGGREPGGASLAFPAWEAGKGFSEPEVALPPMPLGEEVVNDYRFLRLSLRAHPASFLRADLCARGIIANAALRTQPSGTRVCVSGLVTIRQRPGSANGVIFMTIEDETAIANIIVWPHAFERFRPIVLGARYVAVTGKLQQESGVIHVVADRLDDLTPLLGRLLEDAPPIEALARADAVKRPHAENRDQSPHGARRTPLCHPPEKLPDVAADLDVTAPGSAHAPTRRAILR